MNNEVSLTTRLKSIACNVRHHAEQRDEAWAEMDEAMREYLTLTNWERCGHNRYVHPKHSGIHDLDAAYAIERKKVER